MNWQKHFNIPTIEWAQIATQNADHGLVCSNKDGSYQLYGWHIPTGELRQLTFQPNDVTIGSISSDGQRVYYLHETQGEGVGHYFSVSFDGKIVDDLTPDLPAYSSFLFMESHTGNHFGFMSLNQYGYRIFAVDKTSDGTPSLHIESENLLVGPVFSHKGEMTVIASAERSQGTDFHLEAYDTASGQKIAELWDGAGTSIQPNLFSPLAGDTLILAASNQTGNFRPLIWNPFLGIRVDIEVDDLQGDVFPWGWSPDARRVLLYQVHEAQYQLYTFDINVDQLTKLHHPAGTLSDGNFAPNGNIFTVWEDSTYPKRLIELDGQRGRKLRDVLVVSDDIDGRNWESVTFKSDDETQIQAWLAKPEGEPPYPTIIHLHGGPNAVTTNHYDPISQTWLEKGFAYCSINYRGSTTFGSEFENAIIGKPGDLEIMDVVAGVKWLIAEGITDEKAVFITGRSYGGFLALMAMSKHPTLFAGGMVDSPLVDWVAMYDALPESLRDYQRKLFGENSVELQRKSSPIEYVDQISEPLIIFQPENDPRSPIHLTEKYAEQMKQQSKTVEFHVYATVSSEQQMGMTLNFVDKVLKS